MGRAWARKLFPRRAPPSPPSMVLDVKSGGTQVCVAQTGQGLPEQLDPALGLVLLRFCSVLPWRPGAPQLRL